MIYSAIEYALLLFEHFLKVKQLLPLLQTLERTNMRYSEHVHATALNEDQWIVDQIKLPGMNFEKHQVDKKCTACVRKILSLYPHSPAAQILYKKLCLAFLAQIMGEIALSPENHTSILALMLDATAELHRDWDLEQFKQLLLYWPETTPSTHILQKHLEKLERIIPLALTETTEWDSINTSCDVEYKKITEMVYKIIQK